VVIGLPDPESGHRVDAIAQPLDPDEPSVPTTAHDRPQLDEVIHPDFALQLSLQIAPSASSGIVYCRLDRVRETDSHG
jgi:hypothetical protein